MTCGVAMPALAVDQQDRSNADLVSLLNAQVAPRHPSARYKDASTGREFTLDRTGSYTLLKYEDSDEVYALTVSNAQRGDEFFKNDIGLTVLKITELGNVILFMPGDKHGSPAGLEGKTDPIALPSVEGDLGEFAESAAQNLARLADADIQVTIEPELVSYAQWAQSALENVERGFKRTSRRHAVSRVEIVFARHASARLDGDVLTIGVAPHSGFAGRPSSISVARALTQG